MLYFSYTRIAFYTVMYAGIVFRFVGFYVDQNQLTGPFARVLCESQSQ